MLTKHSASRLSKLHSTSREEPKNSHFSSKFSKLLGDETTVFIFLLKNFQNFGRNCDLYRKEKNCYFFLKTQPFFSDFDIKSVETMGEFFRWGCQNNLCKARGAFWSLKKKTWKRFILVSSFLENKSDLRGNKFPWVLHYDGSWEEVQQLCDVFIWRMVRSGS